MKKTALLCVFVPSVILLTAASPLFAKQHRIVPHRGHDIAGESAARPHITCEMVRTYVAQVGLEQARAMAVQAGMTAAEERQARRCLESKV